MTVEYNACPHEKLVAITDENENRTRTLEYCEDCDTEWYGCCAKRGDSWGMVGIWTYSPNPLGTHARLQQVIA